MSQFKRKLSVFAAMLTLISFSGAALAVTEADVLGKTSNADIKSNGSRTDIIVGTLKSDGTYRGKAGEVAQIDFKNFNVGKGEHVNYGFSGVSQTMINRVLGGNESKILGKITNSCIAKGCTNYEDTSKVILINPAGVMFGQGSTVDLNSFTVSTFDIKNAKNLGGMTEAQLKAYENELSKLSPTASVNGLSNNFGEIEFDSNYVDAFNKAGLDMDSLAGKTKIRLLEGAHFNKFTDETNSVVANTNTNKSTLFVADNVEYKDSLIKTGDNYNYSNFNQSFGNVRIVTADGVTFRYLGNGYSDKYTVADDKAGKSVTRTIVIDNSGIDSSKPGIDAGNIAIVNKSNAPGSTIKIRDSYIRARKLVDGENGVLYIKGDDNVEIASSRLDTVNTQVTKAGVTKDTLNKNSNNGIISVNAGKNLNVSDSVITTAGAKNSSASDAYVSLASSKNSVDISNSKILSDGNVNIDSAVDKVNIDKSLIQAKNGVDSTAKKDINITGQKDININNSVADAAGNVNIYSADAKGNVSGNVNITSTPKNGKNQTLIIAEDEISIEGKNTKLDNASLAYKTIKFFGKNTKGLNNVTVKNDSTFSEIDSDKKITGNVDLQTNGNFTMDKATMRSAGVSYDIEADDKTAGAFDFTVDVTPATANNVKVTSTEGNVDVINASNIQANQDITLTSNKKNVGVKDSKLTAGKDINVDAAKDATVDNSNLLANNDANVTAKGGSLFVKKSSKINAGRDVNLTSNDSIKFGNDDDATANIEKSSDIQAGRNITVKSTAGDITGEKREITDLKYGNRLTFDAKKNNIFTSKVKEDGLKSVNVDYVAGEGNKFYTEGDIQFVNSSLKAPKNFIESGKDVILNQLEIKDATTNPEDTKTQIFANGNVTTKDVTGTAMNDVSAPVKNFPQEVATDRVKEPGDTVLNINKTKLSVQTDTVKDSSNPDNGTISLRVQNADNDKAGLELVAQNVEKLDIDKNDDDFKTGYYKSGKAKWDNDIKPTQGPEIYLDADDNRVAIKNIDTDKLTLDPDDKFIADTTTDKLPVITVKDQGGLNLDPHKTYDEGDPNGFIYDENYGTIHGKPEGGKIEFGPWSDYELVDSYIDDEGVTHNIYRSTRDGKITEKTQKDTDPKHTITFGNDGDPESFTLVYNKDKITTEPEKIITAQEVMDDPSKLPGDTTIEDFVDEKYEDCDPVPPVNPVFDSYIDQISLPREQVEVSKTSTVADGTADQTSSIMSAAAKVDIAEGDAGVVDSSNDDEDKELDQ